MCEYSGKLIAWLDCELPAQEAAEVERHLTGCSECRSDAATYQRVSGEIDAYCDAAIASDEPRGVLRWAPLASAVGGVAALVVLFLVIPRTHVLPHGVHDPQATAQADSQTAIASSLVARAAEAPGSVSSMQNTHRRHSAMRNSIRKANPAPAQNQNADLQFREPVIQISIPADEMFPPGAVPEGMHFVADLTIGPDGSAERLRLRPRLAGFERRTIQP
jgi:anti-sigma factor RsiW